jgi:small conductance mechanosensitive channel
MKGRVTLLQEAPADSAAADTTTPLVAGEIEEAVVAIQDSLSTLDEISQGAGEAGRLLAQGEWSLFWVRLYEGLAGLLLEFIPNLLTALFVFVLFYVAYRVIGTILERILTRSKRVEPVVRKLFTKTYRGVGLTFVALMVLAQFGINVTALLAGLSIIGIAVGFAARDTLENFISGITIFLDRPFRVSDNVEVDGVFGTVEEITLRSTRLRTLNSEIMVMPNVQMINQKLINHTMLGVLRVEISFGIAYKESPEHARTVLLELTKGDERLHPDFKPKVVVTEMGASSVDMKLYIFLKNPKLEVPVRFEYTEKIFEALRAAGIEIPFPHLPLFIDEAKGLECFPLLHAQAPSRSPSA